MEKYNITNLLQGTVILDQVNPPKSHKLSGIEVPIIQRDYALGRVSETKGRWRFLKAIFSALVEGREMELDFIYGSIKSIKQNEEEVNVFMPLDGQQRLTTIFLIRWFIVNTELDGDDLIRERQLLSHFTYSTRASARMFCEKLSQIGYDKNPAKEIISSYWYHKSFEMDPTVRGMLNALTDIQSHYENYGVDLYENLDNLQFYILPLDGFDLSDELYIKMNARGKPLTDFENFKADWINWIKSEENPEKALYQTEVKLGDNDVPKYLSIASRLDNQWTDIFWPVAKENEEDKIVDEFFLRFIGRFCLNQFIKSSQLKTKDIEKNIVFKMFYSDSDSTKYDSFDDYRDLFSFANVSQLEKILNSIQLHQSSIREIIKPRWDIKNEWFLYDNGITQIQRILFLAVTEYLARNDFNENSFREWIRIIWNLISDPDIRSIDVMIGTLKTVYNLAEGSADIISFIINDGHRKFSADMSEIQKTQLEEEKLKLSLFANKDWKERILFSETHPLFQGNIGFLINDKPDIAQFINRLKIAFLLFGRQGPRAENDINYRVIRYCISRLLEWNEIEKFAYTNDSRNWQLMLRRNKSVKESILHLCSLPEDELQNEMKTRIEASSSATGMNSLDRLHVIHQNLYWFKDFFNWTQKNSASQLKELNGYWYIIRRGAWYDKVIVDGYRNAVIDKFCELADFPKSKNKCDNSHFFWGENIVFTKKINDTDFKIIFNRQNHVEIRKLFEVENENVWQQIYYDEDIIDSVTNLTQTDKAADQIWNKIKTAFNNGYRA